MNNVQDMLKTHPRQVEIDTAVLVRALDEVFSCAQACTACADACLGEEQVQNLQRCIRTCIDCADICAITGRLASRQTESDWRLVKGQVEICVTACQICAEECERHAGHHEHCRICGDACRRCEEACSQLSKAIAA